MAKKNADVPLTELVDADIDRIDLVPEGANGTPFLIAKSAAGAPGMVPAEVVRQLIAPDVYTDDQGAIVEAQPTSEVRKETQVTTPAATADTTPAAVVGADIKKAKADAKAARAILKQAAKDRKTARIAKKAAKIERKAVLAQVNKLGIVKGTLDSLGDAHKALLDALKNEAGKQEEGAGPSETMTALQALSTKVATLMGNHAASGGNDEAPEEPDGDEPAADTEPVAKGSLRKARKARKCAKCNKQIAKSKLATAKAMARIAKIGARNSKGDQSLLDAADESLGKLGATFHATKTKTAGTPVAAVVKAAEPTTESELTLIQQITGPLAAEVKKAIGDDLSALRQQVEKMAKTPLPGGPRFVTDRDGTVIVAGEDQQGLTFEQAAILKAAEKFPKGSVQREALEKAGAQIAIKELMVAQAQG